jgi:hypothetical protein
VAPGAVMCPIVLEWTRLTRGTTPLSGRTQKPFIHFAEVPALTIVGLEASQNFHLHNGRRASIFIAHDPSFCYRALSSF